jgi:hypothetical protein
MFWCLFRREMERIVVNDSNMNEEIPFQRDLDCGNAPERTYFQIMMVLVSSLQDILLISGLFTYRELMNVVGHVCSDVIHELGNDLWCT